VIERKKKGKRTEKEMETGTVTETEKLPCLELRLREEGIVQGMMLGP
jgi:hypothetical protein